MRFLLDTNILIPLEDSQRPLLPSLANFVRLANENGHSLLYHPASEDDIRQDTNVERRDQTLARLGQYTRLDLRPECPWNAGVCGRNDGADNEILYALDLNAVHALVTEDQGIHCKAKAKGLVDRVYTIQTAEDLLRRLHNRVSVQLPNIEDVPLYSLTPHLESQFFDSLRAGYRGFNAWFVSKAQEGRRAWVNWEKKDVLGGVCIYTRQDDEAITESIILPGSALKLSTFKVGETNRGKKVGELFLKAAFRYATENRLENIFIHGDVDCHHFLFEMLEDFGFVRVGFHPNSGGRDAVYVKSHPLVPPDSQLPPLEYLCKFFPHFRHDDQVEKFIVPIRPEYHLVLFPDYESPAAHQMILFPPSNTAGNAIKMAYLCHAQTKTIHTGSIVLFYRSGDERAITSVGVAESYETLSDVDKIVAMVSRRTVYNMVEIYCMAEKPTRVMLFRLVRHFTMPISQAWLEQNHVLKGPPQSITKIGNREFEAILNYGR